jgi:hypothetical protein
MLGDRISGGRGLMRRVGSRGERMRRADNDGKISLAFGAQQNRVLKMTDRGLSHTLPQLQYPLVRRFVVPIATSPSGYPASLTPRNECWGGRRKP